MLYQIQHTFDAEKKLNYVELCTDSSSAKIILNQGASLQELKINDVSVIKDLTPITYDKSFASSILFPFSNRIKDGKYSFQNVDYQTEINELERNNALHGFVYDKEFQIVKQHLETEKASIVLEYSETELAKGFPFTYKIQLEYILENNSLELKAQIVNTSNSEFPFTLGWHPYFNSSNLNNSYLKFDSSKRVIFDDQMIAKGAAKITDSEYFELKNKKLDDCFYLNTDLVEFVTPNYRLELTSSEENSFLQVYTPPKRNVIAIEPTTGISDSFNNKIGLKTLGSKEKYQISWKLAITNL